MEAPNPKDIKEEKFDWEEHERRYPKQKQYHKESKCIKPADALELEVGQTINDIPLDKRHRYMWIVPDELKDHPMYKEKDYGARIKREYTEQKQKEEDDKVKNDKDKDDKIDMLLRYVADLGKQVNELTKQMKK
jgi:hypothetical protein